MSRKRSDTRQIQIGQAIRAYLNGLPKEALVTLLYETAQQNADLWSALQEESGFEPAADSAQELIGWTEQAIRDATRVGLEWGGNYDAVEKYLRQLLGLGHADAVLRLGVQLHELASKQIELSDESLMFDDVVKCLEVVFEALSRSSLSSVQRMQWVWQRECADFVDVCDKPARQFWQQPFPPQDWSAFAATLQAQLDAQAPKAKKRKSSFVEQDYGRDKIVKKLAEALKKGNRSEDADAVFEREAVEKGQYVRLADRLLEQQRYADALRWVQQGSSALRKKGIFQEWRPLLQRLLTIHDQQKNGAAAAAACAELFFHEPCLAAYEELRKACEAVQLWDQVRPTVLAFVEEGTAEKRGLPPWPLPESGSGQPRPMHGRKNAEVRVDIACAEKQPEDILRWYTLPPEEPSRFLYRDKGRDSRVAEALAPLHLDVAVRIWKFLAESNTNSSEPNRYYSAAVYLAKIKEALVAANRDADWQTLFTRFRESHKAQRKLLATIDEQVTRAPQRT